MSLPCMLSSSVGVTPIATLSAASPDIANANVYCEDREDLVAMVKRSLGVLFYFENRSSSL